ALGRKDAVPALVRQLGRPDPRAPYQKGGGVSFVKEMVRVNHLRNCLLCHPPSLNSEGRVRGLVPPSNQPLGAGGGDMAALGGTFVRADITYLKQDFSAMLPVANAFPWPDEQRFDFLVRERFATRRDFLESILRKKAGPTEQQQSALFALRELTGQDLGE